MWIPMARAGRVQVADPGEVGGRLDLDLNRQARDGAAHCGDAARQVAGAAVGAVGRARRHDELTHAVQPHGRLGHLG